MNVLYETTTNMFYNIEHYGKDAAKLAACYSRVASRPGASYSVFGPPAVGLTRVFTSADAVYLVGAFNTTYVYSFEERGTLEAVGHARFSMRWTRDVVCKGLAYSPDELSPVAVLHNSKLSVEDAVEMSSKLSLREGASCLLPPLSPRLLLQGTLRKVTFDFAHLVDSCGWMALLAYVCGLPGGDWSLPSLEERLITRTPDEQQDIDEQQHLDLNAQEMGYYERLIQIREIARMHVFGVQTLPGRAEPYPDDMACLQMSLEMICNVAYDQLSADVLFVTKDTPTPIAVFGRVHS